MKTRTRQPPKDLRPETKAWWRLVVADYPLEDHHIHLLTLAARAWDEANAARAIVLREGLTTRDRWGQVKAHPACAIEQKSRNDYARLLRELNLDPEAAPELPSPSARR